MSYTIHCRMEEIELAESKPAATAAAVEDHITERDDEK